MRQLSALLGLIASFALGLSACAMAPEHSLSPTPPISIEAEAGLPTSVAVSPTRLAPLRFTIPTAGAEPVSDWRPPLYPVPWAISPYDHFYFVRPIPADEVNWPLASYRYGGVFFGNTVHTGVDFPAKDGSPILAAGSGTVIWADWGFFSGLTENKKDPYGMAVVIRHDFGYQGKPIYTIYAHMQRVDVPLGRWVATGEQLGLVGDTGHTTGPHLHFEIRIGKNNFYDTYNPELWLVPPQGWGVLVGNVMDADGSPLRHYEVRVKSYESGRTHTVRTYGPELVNSDPYYQENLVLSDLPAGWYEIQIDREKYRGRFQLEILPGQVTYFTFQGSEGFTLDLPKGLGMESLTPTPEN